MILPLRLVLHTDNGAMEFQEAFKAAAFKNHLGKEVVHMVDLQAFVRGQESRR